MLEWWSLESIVGGGVERVPTAAGAVGWQIPAGRLVGNGRERRFGGGRWDLGVRSLCILAVAQLAPGPCNNVIDRNEFQLGGRCAATASVG